MVLGVVVALEAVTGTAMATPIITEVGTRDRLVVPDILGHQEPLVTKHLPAGMGTWLLMVGYCGWSVLKQEEFFVREDSAMMPRSPASLLCLLSMIRYLSLMSASWCLV